MGGLIQIKKEVHSLVKITCKIFQPYLKYFYGLTFPNKRPDRLFHLFSFDIILTTDGKPHLIEVISNPSLKVDYELIPGFEPRVPKDYLDRKTMENNLLLKTCDLTVKSM